MLLPVCLRAQLQKLVDYFFFQSLLSMNLFQREIKKLGNTLVSEYEVIHIKQMFLI